MTTQSFTGVNLQRAAPCVDVKGRAVVVPTSGFGALSVSVEAQTVALSAFRARVRRCNNPEGIGAVDYSPVPAELSPTQLMTFLLPVESEYVTVEVTTAESAATPVTVHVYMRPVGRGEVV